MVPEWEKEYMNYESLKKLLKEVKSSKKAKDNKHLQHRFSLERAFSGIHLHGGSNHKGNEDIEDQVIEVKTLEIDVDGSKELYETKLNEERGEAEVRFFEKLDEELNKVNSFYKEQVEAAKNEAILLSKQVETLVALRVKVKSLDSGKCLTLKNQLVR
jgi:SPX domain protein involved in polyphosphate accumulation